MQENFNYNNEKKYESAKKKKKQSNNKKLKLEQSFKSVSPINKSNLRQQHLKKRERYSKKKIR